MNLNNFKEIKKAHGLIMPSSNLKFIDKNNDL